MHMTLDCKRNKGDRWVNSCAVECEKDYVIGERGKMGKRDIVKCIKGVVNTHTTKMDCRRKCTKYPDSCDFPESCIGENEYDQPFCSTSFYAKIKASVKFYPPKN
ncbi:hypothetical protein MHBO_000046 [Bonamia ostreae]|uniref:Uncharacterized protein n=1 Tax=Bonamia ostreae TaxID=126728 RepID=A0ABV2AEV5_9EUKA